MQALQCSFPIWSLCLEMTDMQRRPTSCPICPRASGTPNMAQHHTKPHHLLPTLGWVLERRHTYNDPARLGSLLLRGPSPSSLGCPSRLQGQNQALLPAAMLGEDPLATAKAHHPGPQ